MKNPKANTIGKVIKQLRKSKQLSQEELAFQCSIDRTTISAIERGISTPNILTFLALTSALEMKGWELVKEIEEHYVKEKP